MPVADLLAVEGLQKKLWLGVKKGRVSWNHSVNSEGWRKVRQRKEEEEEEEVGKYMLAFISVIKKQGSRKWFNKN